VSVKVTVRQPVDILGDTLKRGDVNMAAEKLFEERLKKWLETEGIYALGTPVQDMPIPPCGYY
jgi:hypothetical protein